MSAFEMSINVGGYDYVAPDEDAVKAGAPPRVETILTVVQILGMQGQMAAVPLGTVRFGLGKEDAVSFFRKGLEQAERLPAESKITVATDMSQAAAMNRDFEAMRGNE